MRKFLLLAFRNVFRNRRRTAMTLLVVAGGVTGLLLVGGFFSFMFFGLRETTIQNGLGHMQIYNADYFKRDEVRALDNGLDNFKGVVERVLAAPHVKGVAPRIEFYGMVSNGLKSSVFMGTALDPVAEKSLGFWSRITSGRDLEAGDAEKNGAVVGAGLARIMNVKPGDSLTLLAVTADGALNGVDVDVVGIVTTGIKEMDDRLLRVPRQTGAHLLQSERITKLVVGLDRTENTDRVYADVLPRLGGLTQQITIKKWEELATYYRQVKMLFSGIFMFLGVIVFFLVVTSSANTIMMAMFERTREIGTMLAMGTPQSWLVALFVLEAVITGVLGAIGGVVAGNAIGALLNQAHVVLPPPPGNTTGMPLRVLHEPGLMVGASLLVMLTLALASVMPAVRASRLKIVEALSHV
ncbi:MAG: ABC transporter permease [Acidobacteria bacterium]|nr:ABC transporter permease [Acidobacteriota bacterium]